MAWVYIAAVAVTVWWTKGDPLAVIAVVVVVSLFFKQRTLKEAANSLEYWKAREFQLKAEIQEWKEEEKERRLRVREARTERRGRVMRRSKELRMLDKIFKQGDREMLKVLPPDKRHEICKMYGLKPEVVDAWVVLSDAELNKRKLGIDDEQDAD